MGTSARMKISKSLKTDHRSLSRTTSTKLNEEIFLYTYLLQKCINYIKAIETKGADSREEIVNTQKSNSWFPKYHSFQMMDK